MSKEFSTDLEYCSAYSGALLAGCDEVGRGPLCGPVVAAAVILDPANPIEGLADSKKLSDRKREALYAIIKERAVAWCVARASVEEIDKINILHASMLAMQRAVEGLGVAPEYVLVDGNRLPQLSVPSKAVVKGDDKVRCISAASILAKVDRDREMLALDELYPQYGFAKHKGYPTKVHLEAIQAHGVNHLYRTTFRPVARILAKS